MQIAITLVSPDPAATEQARALVAPLVGRFETVSLGAGALDIVAQAQDLLALRAVVDHTLKDLAVDHCVQLAEGRRKRLLVADMDSTIIGCECLDELADFAGVKDVVSAITERAMRGGRLRLT
jgi:phosphoserine phosphatase